MMIIIIWPASVNNEPNVNIDRKTRIDIRSIKKSTWARKEAEMLSMTWNEEDTQLFTPATSFVVRGVDARGHGMDYFLSRKERESVWISWCTVCSGVDYMNLRRPDDRSLLHSISWLQRPCFRSKIIWRGLGPNKIEFHGLKGTVLCCCCCCCCPHLTSIISLDVVSWCWVTHGSL